MVGGSRETSQRLGIYICYIYGKFCGTPNLGRYVFEVHVCFVTPWINLQSLAFSFVFLLAELSKKKKTGENENGRLRPNKTRHPLPGMMSLSNSGRENVSFSCRLLKHPHPERRVASLFSELSS